jgi:hypothetical protein
MATPADVRRIASALPGAIEGDDGTFRVGGKLFAWPWLERIMPGRPRIANHDVLVVRVADELEKDSLIQLDPAVFFTEPHYDGYAAVLVRLAVVDLGLLERLITDSWRLRAPRDLDAGRSAAN